MLRQHLYGPQHIDGDTKCRSLGKEMYEHVIDSDLAIRVRILEPVEPKKVTV